MRTALISMSFALASVAVLATSPPAQIIVTQKNASALGFMAFLEPSGQTLMFRVVGPARINRNCTATRTSLELFDSPGNSVFASETDVGPPEEKVVVRGWFTPTTNSVTIRLLYNCPDGSSARSTEYVFRSQEWSQPGGRAR